MGNLQPLACLEVDHLATENTEAFHLGRFLRSFEEHLIAETDPEKGTVRGDPVDDRFPQFLAIQFSDTISKRANTRENETIDGIKVFSGGHEGAFVAKKLEHIEDVPEISPAIIDDTDAIGHGDL